MKTETLFLDIETLPTARDDVRAYIASTIKPPGNISKAETIAKWEAESKPAAIDEAVSKTSFDGAFGRVCVIGMAYGNDAPGVIYGLDEADVLRHFAAKVPDKFVTIVGHYVSGFDLRFLLQRYIVNGIQPPEVIVRAANAKPWDSAVVFDTMTQWAGAKGSISLDRLCFALGIESPKGDLDGSKVAEYVAAGRIAEVADYCKRDVLAVREVYRRMTFAKVTQPELEDVPA